jgi:hypothetical protein
MRNLYIFVAAAGLAACVSAGLGLPFLAAALAEVGETADGPAYDVEGQAHAIRVITDRSAAKDRAVLVLLAGDCTLLEAAARFRELDAREPRVRCHAHPEVYAGATEAERYCRAVLFWADSATRRRASGDELAAVRRLQDELQRRRLHGTLELPPATPDTE